jgi:hypothetical protein
MVDILSYILSFDGLPAGMTPLSDEQSVWTRIVYQMPPSTNEKDCDDKDSNPVCVAALAVGAH